MEHKFQMEELYEEINKLATMDDLATKASLSDHLGKMTEEVGEFAKEINRLTGRKTRSFFDSTDDITRNAAAEGADAIQCIINVLTRIGVTYEEFLVALKKSNKNYEAWVESKVK